MDELATKLKEHADNIDVTVSDELDKRIRASLENVTPETAVKRPRERVRPVSFWLASSMTGIVAAAVVIAIVNSLQSPPPPAATPASVVAAMPAIDLHAETAMLTQQLQQELDALQSDMRKAEQKVRQEIGL